MRARLAAIAIILTPAFAIPAGADDLNVKLINNTDQAITSVTATPKGAAEPSTASVLAGGEVASSETGTMVIPHQEGECLFDLQITFGGNTIADRPDLDLCQADGVVIE